MNNDPKLAAIQRAVLLSKKGPLTVGEAAKVLGFPGSWTVRRLEARGILPAARRSLAHGDRMYSAKQVAAIQRAIRQPRSESK